MKSQPRNCSSCPAAGLRSHGPHSGWPRAAGSDRRRRHELHGPSRGTGRRQAVDVDLTARHADRCRRRRQDPARGSGGDRTAPVVPRRGVAGRPGRARQRFDGPGHGRPRPRPEQCRRRTDPPTARRPPGRPRTAAPARQLRARPGRLRAPGRFTAAGGAETARVVYQPAATRNRGRDRPRGAAAAGRRRGGRRGDAFRGPRHRSRTQLHAHTRQPRSRHRDLPPAGRFTAGHRTGRRAGTDPLGGPARARAGGRFPAAHNPTCDAGAPPHTGGHVRLELRAVLTGRAVRLDAGQRVHRRVRPRRGDRRVYRRGPARRRADRGSRRAGRQVRRAARGTRRPHPVPAAGNRPAVRTVPAAGWRRRRVRGAAAAPPRLVRRARRTVRGGLVRPAPGAVARIPVDRVGQPAYRARRQPHDPRRGGGGPAAHGRAAVLLAGRRRAPRRLVLAGPDPHREPTADSRPDPGAARVLPRAGAVRQYTSVGFGPGGGGPAPGPAARRPGPRRPRAVRPRPPARRRCSPGPSRALPSRAGWTRPSRPPSSRTR